MCTKSTPIVEICVSVQVLSFCVGKEWKMLRKKQHRQGNEKRKKQLAHRKSKKQARFSYTRVTNQEDFEEIVAFVFLCEKSISAETLWCCFLLQLWNTHFEIWLFFCLITKKTQKRKRKWRKRSSLGWSKKRSESFWVEKLGWCNEEFAFAEEEMKMVGKSTTSKNNPKETSLKRQKWS